MLFGDSLVDLTFSQEAHEPGYVEEEYLEIVNATGPLQHLTTYLSQIITNFHSDQLLGLDNQFNSHLVLDDPELPKLSGQQVNVGLDMDGVWEAKDDVENLLAAALHFEEGLP